MNKWQKKEQKLRIKNHEKFLTQKQKKKDKRYFGGTGATDVQRKALIQQSGGKCPHCGSIDDLHIVKKVPVKMGGSSWSISNMKVICGKCKDRSNHGTSWSVW